MHQIALAPSIKILRTAFRANPRILLERREFSVAWSPHSGVVALWTGDRPRDGGPILWDQEIARWPAGDAGAWTQGIIALMSELRRLRKAGRRGRWKDAVDG